jgi:hypothetical protein
MPSPERISACPAHTGKPSSHRQTACALHVELECRFASDSCRYEWMYAQPFINWTQTEVDDPDSLRFQLDPNNHKVNPESCLMLQKDSGSLFGTDGAGCACLCAAGLAVAGPGEVRQLHHDRQRCAHRDRHHKPRVGAQPPTLHRPGYIDALCCTLLPTLRLQDDFNKQPSIQLQMI